MIQGHVYVYISPLVQFRKCYPHRLTVLGKRYRTPIRTHIDLHGYVVALNKGSVVRGLLCSTIVFAPFAFVAVVEVCHNSVHSADIAPI